MAASTPWRDGLANGDSVSGGAAAARMRGEAREQAYRRAVAHSGRVRFARVALPALAGVVFVAMVFAMWLSRVAPNVGIDLSASAIRDGKLVMANPKLDGFTADDLPYSLRAARAVQDLTGTGVIDLERIQATVPLGPDVEARVLAPAGLYDSDANTLDITKSLALETTDGKRADLGKAVIDLAAGSLVTDEPVHVSMPGAELQADRLRVEDNGRRMLFESRVRLVVQPGAFESVASGKEADPVTGE
ncbi:MAG: LPS export ABC transporter periplasmic protein LptC [Oricola sp.]